VDIVEVGIDIGVHVLHLLYTGFHLNHIMEEMDMDHIFHQHHIVSVVLHATNELLKKK
jgi:hypothetical protein